MPESPSEWIHRELLMLASFCTKWSLLAVSTAIFAFVRGAKGGLCGLKLNLHLE